MTPLNAQSPEKRASASGAETLDIHSMFATFQGEGPLVGRPAFFIRLAGCNLQCPGCDTDYTSRRQRWNLRALMSYLREEWPQWKEEAPAGVAPNRLVVITGGEPFRQDIVPLILALAKEKYLVQIETNGTLGLRNSGDYDALEEMCIEQLLHVVCAPKTGSVHLDIMALVAASFYGAYKYVLSADAVDPTDGLPTTALGHPASPRLARPHQDHANMPVYVQPMDTGGLDQNARNLAAAMLSCQTHGYTLGIQTHKYIGVP